MLNNIILGFLNYCDMSGYDIKQFMAHSTAYFYDASFGSIYPMLKKLEENGLVIVKESVEGGKYKKLYAITEKGRNEFMEWLEQPITLTRTRHEHLVRIFFYSFLPREKAIGLIQDFIVYVEGIYKELETVKKMIKGKAEIFQMATVDFGQEYYLFTIDWCRRFLETL